VKATGLLRPWKILKIALGLVPSVGGYALLGFGLQ